MYIKQREKGSIVIVVSIMVFIILAMAFVLGYANNKKKNELKQTEIQKQTEVETVDKSKEVKTQEQVETEMQYQFLSELKNVVGGKKIKGVVFDGASGNVKASYLESGYFMVASFDNLPDPEDGYFYEGWLVREGEDPDIVSAGRVGKADGAYTNVYTSLDDMTDHDLFVLTLENDDEAKEPSKDRIFEGRLENIEMNDGVPYPL